MERATPVNRAPQLRITLGMRLSVSILLSAALSLPALAHDGRRAEGVERDCRGKIARSAAARQAFKREQPCPATGKARGACPGYVIDHVIPLKRGGPDAPHNMQWQTVAEAKAKDRIE